MNGAELHEYLISQIEAGFQVRKCRTGRQVAVRMESGIGFVDLLAADEFGQLLCTEVEVRDTKRVARDCRKAQTLAAGLVIATPHPRLRDAVRRKLEQLDLRESQTIIAWTYGQVIQRLMNTIPFSFAAFLEEKSVERKQM